MAAFQVIPVAVIFGATACGKTALAARLFAPPPHSERYRSPTGDTQSDESQEAGTPYVAGSAISPFAGKAEIISADSVQVYRGMPVGSAQPPQKLLAALPHHLIGMCSPSEEFSVADFVRHADALCKAVIERGRLPVVLGGTAFYIKHFMYGMPVTPQADPELRGRLQQRLRQVGAAVMHAELKAFDPASAAKIHVNDEYRILRAHEVYAAAGKPLSSFALSYRYREGFRFCPIFLYRSRESLYRRIEARVDEMIAAGLQSEIAQLVKRGCTAASPAMKAIGYREFFELSPEDPAAAPAEAVSALIKRNSKRYAKRQQTFFQSFPNVCRIDMDNADSGALVTDLLCRFYTL